jgi:hypothetical protein
MTFEFEYLEFIFHNNLGYTSGDQVGTFDEKSRSGKSFASIPLT